MKKQIIFLTLLFTFFGLMGVNAEEQNYSVKVDSTFTSSQFFKDVGMTDTDMTVETVFENYMDFIDPNGIISTINSISQTEVKRSKIVDSPLLTFMGDNDESNSVMFSLKTLDGKMVTINKMPTIEIKFVFDGESGYTELSNGTKNIFNDKQLELYKSNIGENVLILEQKPIENAIVKETQLKGKTVYAVISDYESKDISIKTQYFYDMITFKKVGTKTSSKMKDITTVVTNSYDNYINFDGIMQPKLIKSSYITSGGNKNSNSNVNSVTEIDYKFNEDFEHYANQSLKDLASSIAAIPTGASNVSNTFSNAVNTDDSSKIAETLENVDNLSDSEYFNNLNKREQVYQEILKVNRDGGGEASISSDEGILSIVQSSNAKERVSKMDASNAGKLKYRRSSLYTLMLDDNTREHYNIIKDAFGNTEISEKFNNHNIGAYLIPANGSGGEKDQTQLIEDYLNNTGVAKNMVAKWFNRDEKGRFNMNLIAERGQYNASEIDLKIAQSSIRGKALLSDAGRELIGNTFIIVYDYKYTNKQEQAKKRGGFLNALSSVASYVPGGDNISTISSVAKLGSDVVGKGYFVRTSCYLYRLEWNDEIAQEFYENLWNEQNSYDETKKEAFDRSNLFKLKYVGSEVSRNNLQSTIFSSKSNEQLIEIATIKAVDKNIGKLQRTYEEFRVKTPLLSTDPIAAKIGLKEDLSSKDKFEVLEQVLNEDGSTSYERVGLIKVDKSNIWDNTYLSLEANQQQKIDYTIFKGKADKMAPGMLIRQIN